jgi:hypothetical protein
MDLEKIKKMDKAKLLYELDRVSRLEKINDKMIKKLKEKKKPDSNIFDLPKKPKAEDYFSIEFLNELKDYTNDKTAKKTLLKLLKNKSETESSSSDEE